MLRPRPGPKSCILTLFSAFVGPSQADDSNDSESLGSFGNVGGFDDNFEAAQYDTTPRKVPSRPSLAAHSSPCCL
jgi:hypothetical protein